MQHRILKALKFVAWCLGIVLAALFLTVHACSFFPESSFDLAQESRLPKWFALPANLTRSQVTVHLDYHVLPWGRRADFTFLGPRKEVLAKVNGTAIGNEPFRLKTQPPAFPPGYPAYELITVRGVTDLVEHRKMAPIFYIEADPAVWNELVKLFISSQRVT